ncbi:Sodium/hydrogen exchanger family-domain-containing protein [Aspergillus falconensis]
MLHPILDISDLNVILVVTSLYALLIGFISFKVKQRWYLGEALSAFALGAAFGPSAANFLKVPHPGGDESEGTTSEVTYALTRLLPKKYLKRHLKEMTICLLPLMAIGWIASSACVMLMVPHISFLAALVIGSCVTCTDPILSQAIAKGPFADNYVRRHLREFISSEAGGNDGFGSSFMLLGLALLRYADTPANAVVLEEFDLARGGADLLGATDVGRFGGGAGKALKHWFVEGFLYMIVLGGAYGITVGFVIRKVLTFSSRRYCAATEGGLTPGNYALVPAALGAFIVGSCGCFGSDETLVCFIAGNMLNWDGMYNAELQARHGSSNSSLETILNHIIFGYLGAVMPWEESNMPDTTGITIPRLLGLGMMIPVLRRVPAIITAYRFMPEVSVGAIAYVEYARRLFPDPGKSNREINRLTAMRPVHGLSVPTLYVFYKALKVPKVHEHPVELVLLSKNEPSPNNSTVDRQRHSILVNNRFSEPNHLSVLNEDSDEKESSDLRQSCERARPRSARSSMSYSSGTPISREASQRPSHETDPRDIV